MSSLQESQFKRRIENAHVEGMKRLVLEYNEQISREMPDPYTVDCLLGKNFDELEEAWRNSAVMEVVAVTWRDASFASNDGVKDAIKALEL